MHPMLNFLFHCLLTLQNHHQRKAFLNWRPFFNPFLPSQQIATSDFFFVLLSFQAFENLLHHSPSSISSYYSFFSSVAYDKREWRKNIQFPFTIRRMKQRDLLYMTSMTMWHTIWTVFCMFFWWLRGKKFLKYYFLINVIYKWSP